MKILHILDHSIPLPSGYAFRTLAILREQVRLGWQTIQLTSAKHADAGAEVEVVDGFTFYRTAAIGGWLARLPLLNQWLVIQGLQQRLNGLAEREQPDVLHAHSPALTGIASLMVARKRRIPVVYECRAFWEDAAVEHGKSKFGDWRYRLGRALESYVFRRADAVAAICQGLREDIVARGVDSSKVFVVPNAVDVERFAFGRPPDDELHAQLQLQNMTVLGFFGSFYAYEGLSLLLEALSDIVARRPGIRLLLAGGGPEQAAIQAKIAELKLGEQVLLLGRLPHQQIERYYSLVDVLIYPRLSSRLTELVTPLKPLEAMAQGRIVLASDVAGHRELIRDGETGYLFKADDRAALATKILAVLDERGQWPGILTAARQYVASERTWQAAGEVYRRIYRQVMAK